MSGGVDVLDDLQGFLDTTARELGVPGASVGIVDGDADHIITTGVASVQTGAAVTGDTLFAIGSTSKTVTGTAAMRLVEQGAFDLETPVSALLPDLRLGDRSALAQLRVRHLLTHSGGFLGDLDDEGGWDSDALSRSIAGFDRLPQLFAPGTISSYSNSGIRLLGHLVATVTGQLFEDTIRESVLTPLCMDESVYLPWEALNRPVAVGHVLTGGRASVSPVLGLSRDAAPEGGLLSSVRDQLKYARFQLRGETEGSQPVGDATRISMQRSHQQAGPPIDGIGLPWLLSRIGDARIVKHGGNISNIQLSEFVMAPDHDLAITVLTNAASALGPQIVSWCLERFRGIRPAPAAEVALHGSPDDVLGRYDVNQWQHIVTREGEELVIASEFREDLAALGLPPLPTVRARLGADGILRNDAGQGIGQFVTAGDDTQFLHMGLRAAPRL